MLTQDQILAAQKANLETLFGLTQKAFEGVEKMVELNMQATKAAFDESTQNLQSALGAKDLQELLTLQAAMLQPLAEKTAAYSRELYDIAAQTAAVFGQTSSQQGNGAQNAMMAVMDNLSKNAPAGSESAMLLMKNSMLSANEAMENVQRVLKQASELAESNFKTLTSQAAAHFTPKR
mgnify:CR=1 FL=1